MPCACNTKKDKESSYKIKLANGTTKTFATEIERNAALSRYPGSKKV